MRIFSWNVNGIRAAGKHGFALWLARESPDMLCIQETKATPQQLGRDLLNCVDADGNPYHAYWASAKKPGYSGVAIYSRTEPDEVKFLGEAAFDDEGRVLQAVYGNLTLISAYFPNSQDGGARLPYKLDFCAAILKYCKKLVKEGKHFILCGDYNIAHTPLDLARPKENEGSAGYLPEERAWMGAFLKAGFVDTFRAFHEGEGGHYSWWSYRAGARARNVGWRIDYQCVDGALAGAVKSASIFSDVEGSDHCPIGLELDI